MKLQMALLLSVMAITLVFWRKEESLTRRKICIFIVTIILTCFSGFRSWWIGDCIKYYTLYRSVVSDGLFSVLSDSSRNVGLRLFFAGMGSLGVSYDTCIFLIAAFVALTLGIIIYRYSPAPYWSYLPYIAIGFYMFTFSGLKQTVAMGFILLAAIQIFEDRPVRYVVLVILAGLFHLPALIFLPAYLIAKKRIDGLYFFILFVIAMMLFFYRDSIVTMAVDLYYDAENKFFAKELIGGKTIVMILMLVVSVYFRPPRRGDWIYSQVYNLMVFAAIIQSFSVYNNVFTRLADYYFQFIILFLPLMLENGEHQLLANPHPQYVVRELNREIYVLAGIILTVAFVWYYSLICGSYESEFMFFWQQDEYLLYGK